MKKIKNSTLLIGAGGVFLLFGLLSFIIFGQNNNKMKNNDGLLTKEEAIALINDKTKTVIDLFENQSEVFDIVESDQEDLYQEVNNYDKIIKNLYSEEGIKQLEKSKFGENLFVKKNEDNKVFLLKDIPEDNRYKGTEISTEIMDIKKDSIVSEVTITTYKMKDDVVTYYVIVKDVELIKKDNEWLIKDFSYPNE